MFSLCRVIPESSQVRLPTDSPGRGSAPASFPVSGPVALSAIRPACSCKRNVIRCRDHAALFPAQMRRGMHAAIDAACVLRLSSFPMPYAGEA
jgi:hypothetical protein